MKVIAALYILKILFSNRKFPHLTSSTLNTITPIDGILQLCKGSGTGVVPGRHTNLIAMFP